MQEVPPIPTPYINSPQQTFVKNTHHEPSVFRSKSCRTQFRSAFFTFLSRFMYHIT